MKTSESVVHPISPEPPLEPQPGETWETNGGQIVRIGRCRVGQEGIQLIAEAEDGSWWDIDFDGKAYKDKARSLRRISHTPTPEPAKPDPKEEMDKYLSMEITQAVTAGIIELVKKSELEAQEADLLEEADRVNPRLMQATDEQIEAEYELRKQLPRNQVKIQRERLENWQDSDRGYMFRRALAAFEEVVRQHERELIKQEGGSHE